MYSENVTYIFKVEVEDNIVHEDKEVREVVNGILR